MTRCKNGTRKNKEGKCVAFMKKPKTTSSKRGRQGSSQEWNSKVEKEFDEILKELRKGKLQKNDMGNQLALDCKSCLKRFTLEELQAEIESRSKINILIPRKKKQV